MIASRLPRTAHFAVAAIAVAGLLALQPSDVRAQDVLVVGADVGANPYIIGNPDGTINGFNVDLVNEVAARLGRSGAKIIDQQFSGIFAGLEACQSRDLGDVAQQDRPQ